MLSICTRIIFFITFIVTFIANGRSNNNIRLIEIKSITTIIQIGALFDVISFVLRNDDAAKLIVFLYSVIFPLCVIFASKISSVNKYIFPLSVFIISIIFVLKVDDKIIKANIDFFMLGLILLGAIAIGTCVYNTIKIKRKLNAKNYFYYLLIGFLISDLFYTLGYYKVIDFEITIWMKFLAYYLIYLNILRIIYIAYVAKNL